MLKFRIVEPLSPYGAVNGYDVHELKAVLNRLGYYMPQENGIEEFREPALFEAVKKFQRDNGIKETVWLLPHDATIYALDRAVKNQDMAGRYVWRTAGDERVRDGHAAREGQIFRWGDPPEGGHPGEDFNCRCWAVAVVERKPQEKKDCKAQEEAYAKAVEEFQQLDRKKAEIENELERLQNAFNDLDARVGNNWMITAVADWLPGVLGYATGNVVQNEAEKAQEEFIRRKKSLEARKQYLKDELTLVMFKLNKAAEQVLQKRRELEECRRNASG